MRREMESLLRGLEGGIVHHVDARRLWKLMGSDHRPSDKTLDRLALLAGFQNWQDLRESMRGESDAAFGFEEDSKKPRPSSK